MLKNNDQFGACKIFTSCKSFVTKDDSGTFISGEVNRTSLERALPWQDKDSATTVFGDLAGLDNPLPLIGNGHFRVIQGGLLSTK